MLVVVALGGHALLRQGEPATADVQRCDARVVARALAPIAAEHQMVIRYGNGPQESLLARQGEDHNDAQAEQVIAYMIERELRNLLPLDRPFATIATMVAVDPRDAAFANPATVVGPACAKDEADRLAVERGWTFKPDGDRWRRVVASPGPKRTFALRPIKWLLGHNTVVIACGGGFPVMYESGTDRRLTGVDCVIDKDFASELLARELGADLFVMLTDADAVYTNWGRSSQAAIRRASPASLETFTFAAGSMGPKVSAACRFTTATGHRAAIGALTDFSRIVAGEAGTTISIRESGIVYAPSSHPAPPLGESQ